MKYTVLVFRNEFPIRGILGNSHAVESLIDIVSEGSQEAIMSARRPHNTDNTSELFGA
jgi:hypothetical protein